ncbi:MAG: hypothetical protein R6V34_02745 [Bacteroidales bacterium]
MRKGVKNIKASVRARLKNISEETNRPFQEILQYYGMERFLYRLSKSEYKDKFILKGVLMLSVWDVSERRSTDVNEVHKARSKTLAKRLKNRQYK